MDPAYDKWCYSEGAAHIHTIFLVKILNVEGKLTSQDDLVIKLVPASKRCQPRTRELCYWAEVEPIQCETDAIDKTA